MKFFSRLALVAAGVSLLGLSAFAQTADNNRADSYPRNTVVEVFTGEWCGWCPLGKFFVERAIKQLPEADQARVIVSYIHDGDFISQQFPEAKKLAAALEGTFGISGFPGGLIDRTKTTTYGSVTFGPTSGDAKILKALKERLGKAAEGTVDFTLAENGGEFTMEINGEIASSILDQDLYLTSYLIRDSIPKKSQGNYVTNASVLNGDTDLYAEYQAFWKNYKHDHTVLQPLTAVQGDKIAPGADGKFSVTKTFTPNFGTYSTEFSHVVVIVHYSNSTKKGVINAAKKELKATTDIVAVTPEEANVAVFAQNGVIRTSADVANMAIYTLDGRTVPNYSLTSGVYVVRIQTTTGTVIVTKVLVR